MDINDRMDTNDRMDINDTMDINDVNSLYDSMIPYEEANFNPSQQDVSYNKANKTSIKQHITSAITKFFNTLYYDEKSRTYTHVKQPNTKPISYQYNENFIGVSNFIFYIINAPLICNELLNFFSVVSPDKKRLQALILLLDTRFQNIYVLGKKCHVFNSICSRSSDLSSKFTDESKNLFEQNEILKNIIKFENLNLTLELDHLGSPTLSPYDILVPKINSIFSSLNNEEQIKIFTVTDLVIAAIMNILKEIKNATERLDTLSFVDFSAIMEWLSPFFIYYFKGGNSLHKIFERYNEQCIGEDEQFKIDITNVIPYGSDFDTNLLISPYLNNYIYNKISNIVEISISQISQFIQFPSDMLHKFENPTADLNNTIKDLLVGKKDSFEKKYMNILFNSYEIVSKYMFKNKYQKQERQTKKERENKEKHFITLRAETIQTNPNQLPIPVITVYQASDSKRFWWNSFSKFNPATISDRYINPTEMSDGLLQLNINKSIEGFNLFRFFLKFQFNTYDKKSNPTARLTDLHKCFNNEVLDISVIKNRYVKKGDKYYGESVELWNNALDIFKDFVVAETNILRRLKDKYSHLRISPMLFTISNGVNNIEGFPYFCNGVRLQYEDLLVTIGDNVRNKKTEKLEKRIKRFKVISQVALFDLSKEYNKYYYEYFLNIELIKINTGFNDIYKDNNDAGIIRANPPLYKFMNELFLQFKNSLIPKFRHDINEQVFYRSLLNITLDELRHNNIFERMCFNILYQFCLFCRQFWVLGFDAGNQKNKYDGSTFYYTIAGTTLSYTQIIDLVPISEIRTFYKNIVYAGGPVDMYTNNYFNLTFLLISVFIKDNISLNINKYGHTLESYLRILFSELDKSKIISNIFRLFYSNNELVIKRLLELPVGQTPTIPGARPFNHHEYLNKLFSRPVNPIFDLHFVAENVNANYYILSLLINRFRFLVSMYTIFCVKKLYFGSTNWDSKILIVCNYILKCYNQLTLAGFTDLPDMALQLISLIHKDQNPVIFFEVANLIRIWNINIHIGESFTTIPYLIIINPFYASNNKFMLANYYEILEHLPTLNNGYQDIDITFEQSTNKCYSTEPMFLELEHQLNSLPNVIVINTFQSIIHPILPVYGGKSKSRTYKKRRGKQCVTLKKSSLKSKATRKNKRNYLLK